MKLINKMTHKTPHQIGTALITISLISTLTIFYPILKEEILYKLGHSSFNQTSINKDFALSIPSIHLSSNIIPNISPWDKEDYLPALQKGVAHASGSALPNQIGTTYLFAHSSGNPWQQAYTNTAFYRLNKLKKNNIITLAYLGTSYQYKVADIVTVKPDQVQYLIDQTKDQLILQTCTPIGTDWNRLLVIAQKI